MPIAKLALVASAGASLFAAASANAVIIGDNAATVGRGFIRFLTTQVSSVSLTGRGTLEDSGQLVDIGTYTATSSGVLVVSGFPNGTIGSTETFTGSYSGGTFTPTVGSLDITSCTGSNTVCAGATSPAVKPFNTGVSGSLTLAGGTLIGTAFQPSAGTVPSVTSWYSFVIGPFTPITPVPLPPAAWLLGSGLLGLIGTARRRKPTV